MKFKTTSATNPATAKVDTLLVGVFEGEVNDLTNATDSARSVILATANAAQRQAVAEGFKGAVGETLVHFSDNRLTAKNVVFYGLGARDKTSIFTFRKAVTAALKRAKALKAEVVGFTALDAKSVAGEGTDTAKVAETVASYAAMIDYVMNHQKTAKGGHKKETRFRKLHLIVDAASLDATERGLEAGFAVGRAVNFARDLANEPANELTPHAMTKYARGVAAASNGTISCTVHDRKALKKMGANLLLAVSQGSEEPPYLMDLVYTPAGYKGDASSEAAQLTIVGKSVTFDSGGIDIKVNGGSRHMKRDMSGGGVAMAAIQVIAALGLNIKVRAVMAATENMVDGKSYKPGDVLTSMNGLTVEIDNTDAEGRLTLADAIEYAKRKGDTNIVDLATLTGAVKGVTGDVGACAFGNHDDFTNTVVAAAMSQDEKLLNVPMWEEFRASNNTEMADLKNSGGQPGSTTAAFFLRAFAGEEINWVHLDIAGVAFRDRELGPDPRGATGFGVRTLVELARRLAK
ncbi:MAG: leucyl aminopeptidase [Cyanobacteria bacterium SZAS LIN-3]|nr:leucyl aminopeptidase [Cyanobacteria bacterium SZAS LIN-3]